MAESKTTATAVVTMTVSVHLTQPWGGEFTLADVQRQARADAEQELQRFLGEFAKHGIRLGGITTVRIVLNEERGNG